MVSSRGQYAFKQSTGGELQHMAPAYAAVGELGMHQAGPQLTQAYGHLLENRLHGARSHLAVIRQLGALRPINPHSPLPTAGCYNRLHSLGLNSCKHHMRAPAMPSQPPYSEGPPL